MDGVVPIAMETVRLKIDGGHLGVRDISALRIGSPIEFAANAESARRPGGADEIDDHRETHQGLAAPIGADVREEPVFDLDVISTLASRPALK